MVHSRLLSGARLAGFAAGFVALAGLAACGGRSGGESLLYTTINIESITQMGNCENVGVKVTPLELAPTPPSMANSNEFVTQIELTKGEDNVSCTGQAITIPMAPGNWRFQVMLPSDISTCEKEITATSDRIVTLRDGVAGCA